MAGLRHHRLRVGLVVETLEAVPPAIDDLLEAEERDERAGNGDDGVEIGDRQHRGHAIGREPRKKIEPAIPDHAQSHGEHDEPRQDLDGKAWAPFEMIRDSGQIEMVIAPAGDARADEDAVDEASRRHLLQRQHGMAQRPRQDVDERRAGEAQKRRAAKQHQQLLQGIERRPFEMPLTLQHEAVEI